MYCKLFASLYQGTLRGRSDEILVFTNLLAHTSAGGVVDKHFRAIAEETGLTIERVKEAIHVLESADDESRSPEADGARLVRLDEHRVWGWQVVNHGKYRAIKNEDDRAEQNRLAQQRFRDRQKAGANGGESAIVSSVSIGNQRKPKQKQKQKAEAEAEADVLLEKEPKGAGELDLIPEIKIQTTNPIPESIRLALQPLYRRGLDTAWSSKEVKTWKKLNLSESQALADIALFSKARATGWTYYRRDIETLLNNWQAEVEKASHELKQTKPMAKIDRCF